MSNLKFFHPPTGTQRPTWRVNNFNEVCQGLSKRVAVEESRRCPQCGHPTCKDACPLGIDIPGFIRFLREGHASDALSRIHEANPFANICGRVCMAPCEKACVLATDGSPIAIRALERFAADHGQLKYSAAGQAAKTTGKKVAIVGSGAAGLTAARMLVRKNYQVTVFEALPTLGGVLRYGIPEFRLPHKILDREIAALASQGVEFKANHFVSRDLTLDDIFAQGFACMILATGTGGVQLSDLPGANLGAVYYAEEVLMSVNLSSEKTFRQKAFACEGKTCVVIGKNYAALDCARVAVRLGKATTLVFDVTQEDLEIYPQDLEQAQEEGIKFSALTRVLEITTKDNVLASGVKCAHMDFADPHGSEKWELMPVPDSEFILDTDMVIVSLGHRYNTSLPRVIPGLKCNKDGTIWFSDKNMPSLTNVVVAGDAETGASSLVRAMASGKAIAQVVEQYLAQK